MNEIKEEDRKRLYGIFACMKYRCYSKKNDKTTKIYRDRGIKICDEWLNDINNFYEWAINNGYQSNLSIDRIDVDGDYEPANCRWATAKQQLNNRRTNLIIEHNGIKHTFSEWCDILGISERTVRHRLEKGRWTMERALFTPLTEHDEFINNGKLGNWEENFNKWLEKKHRSVRCVCKELLIDKVYYTIMDASRDTGIAYSSIINNAKGRSKTCRKDGYRYVFTYVDEQKEKS